MSTTRPDRRGRIGRDQASRVATTRQRALLCGTAGLAFGAGLTAVAIWRVATLLGWDLAAASFLVWLWAEIWTLTPEAVAAQATREDPGRALADSLLVLASLSCIVGVGFVLKAAGTAKGYEIGELIALGVASVILSWFVVHTIFTLRYARLYYSGGGTGVEFHQEEPPAYPDFAYLAFTVGMTFQVSDTDLGTPKIRATVLQQALISYLFGAVIVAMTVNVAAGLLK